MSTMRQMQATDLLQLSPVNLDPLTETYNLSFYLEYLAKWPDLCQVVTNPHTGAIEGYILAKTESSPHQVPTVSPYDPSTNKNEYYLPWHAHITALSVSPGARRQGLARKLTSHLEYQGDRDNCWFVDLYVRVDNDNAIKLYKSLGYSVWRRVVKYYADESDAFDMRKSLRRDAKGEHVREHGEEKEVDPRYVW